MSLIPVVDCTVVVLAYNLENFIGDCLESIESQRSEFNIKILIHDDCSTDNTLQIIKDFASRSKYEVEIVVPNENRYKNGMGFFYELLAGCTSKYVAVLDGDDTWTDPSKLSSQINLLESNPDMAISSHVFSIVNQDMSEELGTWPNREFRNPISSYRELAQENFIGALTVVFRRDCLPAEIQGYERLGTGDYGLWGLISGKGDIGFIDRNMANYRQHDTQVYANRSDDRKASAILDSRIFVANHSGGEVRKYWIDAIATQLRAEVDLELAASQQELAASQQELAASQRELAASQQELAYSVELNERFGVESESLKHQIELFDNELQIKAHAIESMYESFSWKITRPIRRIAILLKTLRNR